jgi:hypothetical protein
MIQLLGMCAQVHTPIMPCTLSVRGGRWENRDDRGSCPPSRIYQEPFVNEREKTQAEAFSETEM